MKEYEIKSGTLGYKYVVQVTFDNKEDLEPLERVIKRGFQYFKEYRQRLEQAKKLEEKRKINQRGLL